MSIVSFDPTTAAEYARAMTRALPGTAVLLVAADGTIQVAEGQPLVRYGAPASVIVGRRLDQIVPGIGLQRLQRHYALAFAGCEQQFDYRTVSGATCSVWLSPIGSGGREAVAVLVVIEDLTERRRPDPRPGAPGARRSRSEELFRQGFDNSPIGMALVDPRTRRYLQVNDAICRLTGRPREHLLELTSLDITLPGDIGGDDSGLEAILTGSAPSFEVEKRYVKPDGEIVWALLHVVPVRGDGDEVEAFFAQVVDITARKERELALIQEAAELEQLSAIRAALREERLVLHAQPIVALGSGEVVQQELLVRLQQPDGRIVPPAEFLPIAERHGTIQEIDRWVTERAIELAATGHPVEVNLSAASVGDAELLATIRAALARTQADPSLLVFEVTETALMADVERAREFAAALRALGCRFALDDFGTGYGTFTYLKHIPIDYVKIDVEFVRDLCTNEADQQLVAAIVTMAGGLGKQTVAEGVEDGATLERLRELGVDRAQGYFIGRPRQIAGN